MKPQLVNVSDTDEELKYVLSGYCPVPECSLITLVGFSRSEENWCLESSFTNYLSSPLFLIIFHESTNISQIPALKVSYILTISKAAASQQNYQSI